MKCLFFLEVNHFVVEIGNQLLDFKTSFNLRGREIEMFMVWFKIMKFVNSL
ncbi:hypothetical protein Hanom_Chr06g00494671 [Helianthus anomalus]